MEETMIAPAMQFSTPPPPPSPSGEVDVDVDVDVEAITRKRARSRIARRFRIVTSTVVACNRFRFVLEVEAPGGEKPEQARSDLLAALSSRASLDEQSSSDGAVDACGHEGLCTTYTQVYPEVERSVPYGEVVGGMFTAPDAGPAFLYGSNQVQPTTEGEESGQYEQGIQHVQNLLDAPDGPSEGLQDPPSVRSDWGSLHNLLNANENSQRWMELAAKLNDEVTKKIEDLERGSGREKLQKLVENAEDIIRKLDKPPEVKKAQKVKALSTSPTVREAQQFFSELLEEMQFHVNELSSCLLGRPKQVNSVTAMSRLIENGRKALQNLGRGTEWISGKLNALVKDLKYRERTVDRHFQKCAESIPALVESFLQQRKGSFVSMALVTDWLFEEKSSRLLGVSCV